MSVLWVRGTGQIIVKDSEELKLTFFSSKIEQHCAIKFCLKLGMNATETCGKLREAYGEGALS